MSAPMVLSARDLRRLADSLDALTEMRKKHGTDVNPYGQAEITVADVSLGFKWDKDDYEYVIDDRCGS